MSSRRRRAEQSIRPLVACARHADWPSGIQARRKPRGDIRIKQTEAELRFDPAVGDSLVGRVAADRGCRVQGARTAGRARPGESPSACNTRAA